MNESDSAPTAAPPPRPPAPAEGTPERAPDRAPERLNFLYHVIVGVGMGIAALFTGFAWAPAILTGIIIGQAEADRRQGIQVGVGARLTRVLAVSGGVLAMLILGAIIGGIIAFLVAAGATFSERLAANTSQNDRTIARILITIVTIAVWFVTIYVLQLNVNINIGG